MFHIIAILIFGILVGYRFRNIRLTHQTEKTMPLTVMSLLFILGLSIGSNEVLISNIGSYGRQAAVLSIFCLGGSILLSWLVYKIAFKKGGEQ